jgi:hypothetical protein
MMAANFFEYQQQKLDILKWWGLGSVVLGAAGMLQAGPRVRHAGMQALTWGAIDAALAFAGQHGAAGKARRLDQGALSEDDLAREIRNFRRILLINAGLDVGYVLGGVWLLATAGERHERQGMGMGIIIQGLFLLLYDTALAQDVQHRWLG